MTKKNKRILVALGAAVVIGGVVAGSAIKQSRSQTEVQLGEVGRSDLDQIVVASGEVRPRRYVNVGANVSGRILELRVREGDSVEKGQILARVESERYEAGERQSAAGVEAAKADLDRARADLEASNLAFGRVTEMRDEQLVSAQAYDQADAERKMKAAAVDGARRRVAQLQAALDSTRDDLYKTTVYAPMSGVITSLPKEEGEMVIGAMSFNPTVLMTVADLSVMEAEVMVDETDIRDLKVGQKAEVSVDALGDLTIMGEVTEIGASAIVRGSDASQAQGQLGANTGNQAKDFKVKIVLADPPANLRPGLNASTEITTAVAKNVIAVPIQSVVVREVGEDGKVIEAGAAAADEDDESAASARERGEERDGVFIVREGKAIFTPVQTGIMGDTDIEILEGLDEGQQIVTGSYRTLRSLENEARVKREKDKGKGDS